MSKLNCAIFISDVGFGHMVRQRLIIKELFKIYKNISITIFHKKNLKELKKSFGNKIRYIKNFNNISLAKNRDGSLDIKKLKKICKNWEKKTLITLNNNSNILKKFDFFISDLVPEISYYAFKNQKPCFSICHFTWDWFFRKIYKKNTKSIRLMKKYNNLSTQIYFPPLTSKKILNDTRKYKKVNFITDVNYKKKKFNKNKLKILIMDNGTEVLASKISKILPFLVNFKKHKFFISMKNVKKNLKMKIQKSKNVRLINSNLKHTYNFIKKTDIVVARAGFNTITECIILKKPTIFAHEKNNPEVTDNIKNIKKIKLFTTILDNEWTGEKFFQKLKNFIFTLKTKNGYLNNVYKQKNLNNGAKNIVKDMKLVLKKIEK